MRSRTKIALVLGVAIGSICAALPFRRLPPLTEAPPVTSHQPALVLKRVVPLQVSAATETSPASELYEHLPEQSASHVTRPAEIRSSAMLDGEPPLPDLEETYRTVESRRDGALEAARGLVERGISTNVQPSQAGQNGSESSGGYAPRADLLLPDLVPVPLDFFRPAVQRR